MAQPRASMVRRRPFPREYPGMVAGPRVAHVGYRVEDGIGRPSVEPGAGSGAPTDRRGGTS